MSRRGRDFADERDFVDVRVREREQERDRDPLARYFQEDRRSEAGALVLRQRDVETFERPRPRARSPSPANYRYTRSVSPMPPREREVDRVEIRDRVIDRERPRQFREPSRERVTTRVVARERERSPTPSPDREREIRITERSRRPSPSPSPSPPPASPRQVIRGPVVEREVITHYTDVDHGVVYAPQPVPPPPVRERERERDRDTEIDIYSSRRRTEVNVHESTSRERRRSQSRPRRPPPARASEQDVVVRSDRNRLEIDIDDGRNRRSHSAQPARTRYDPVAEEARYVESRIDDRGEIGEAYHGATKDWTIVDVPPGTERVRMDGVGGGSADVTWQRYNGVRRTRFIPDRDDEMAVAPRHKMRQAVPERERGSRDHINVQITGSRDRDIDIDTDRRTAKFPPREFMPAGRNDMWTEITKDLVSREAMDQLGYDYNETEYFYYILEYLRYEDVQELVQLSDRIRKNRRKQRHHSRDDVDVDVDVVHRRQRSHSHHRPRREDDRVYEREVVVDRHLRPTHYR